MAREPKVFIHKSELDIISRYVMDYPDLETGGDFFGFWSKDGDPVIQLVIGPGKKTTRTPTSFYQDIEYLKKCGQFLHNRFHLEHIGAWHSHHRLSLREPSSGDINTMQNALKDDKVSRFLISIFNIDDDSGVSFEGFLFTKDNFEEYTRCIWNIEEGESPIREAVMKSQSGLLEIPRGKDFIINPSNIESENSLVSANKFEKPDLPQGSYWTTLEGRKYLKMVFDKMQARDDIFDTEIVQLPDKRIAISFAHDHDKYQIRFPDDFPKSSPEVVGQKKEEWHRVRNVIKSFLRPSERADSIQKLLYSLGVVDDGTVIIIRYQ